MQSENNQEKSGKKYWRSLEEMAETPELLARMKNEFPTGAAELEVTPGVDRRKFLGIIGASAAFAGLTSTAGCIRKPVEKILPYNKRPEDLIEGKPQYYASAGRFGGSVLGLLVTSYEGRPTKIDGNPTHPLSMGATNTFAQAAILDLYDPDRSQNVLKAGVTADGSRLTSASLKAALANVAKELSAGQGTAILMEAVASPTLLSLVKEFKAAYPKTTIAIHDPAMRWNEAAALGSVGFDNCTLMNRFEEANVIVAVDSDPLGIEGDVIRNSKTYAAKRKTVDDKKAMSRLYAVEPAFTLTGAVADHRLSLRSSAMGEFILSLAAELSASGLTLPSEIVSRGKQAANPNAKWIRALASDLIANKGQSVLVIGNHLKPWIHEVAFLINTALGNVGRSVVVRPNIIPAAKTLQELTAEMNRGSIQTLIMLDVNPVYTTSTETGFAEALAKVKTSLHLGYHADETAKASTWHFPRSHFLESWGDLVGTDGTASIVQPLIEPLFPSLSEIEFLAGLLGKKNNAYELVQAQWKSSGGENFSASWRRWLHDGVIPVAASLFASDSKSLNTKPDFSGLPQRLAGVGASPAPSASQLELRLSLDRSVYDGRYANNAWLQEIPDTVTKLTWDNAVLLSPKTAKEKGIKTGDMVEIKAKGEKTRSLKIAAFVVPGVAEHTLVVQLGYGRPFNGRVSSGTGFNGYSLLGRDEMFVIGAEIQLAGGKYELATTQEHGVSDYEYDTKVGDEAIKTRGVYREVTLATVKSEPSLEKAFGKFNLGDPKNHRTLLWTKSIETRGNQWGMTIDLNSCTGCNACTAACQAENNISVVGKKRVLKSREMHWIRIDRYFAGNVDNPDSIQAVFQPLACAHCETAPCEQVCPVAATVHGTEGTNDIAYNRCIGTRYCANNCPYKVRRFNYFNFSKENDAENPLYAMQKNPRVTVRFRGVIEKCTYCIQRVNAARIDSKLRGEEIIRDGAVVTACQQVCPTDAITFGNINDADSRVSQMKALPRNYALLSELALEPRTTFLAKVRNTNPEISPSI
ncbi:MAG: 4Fe-4S dicluster domain-containing protein [Proteobacteria bacterium]|nr:4Fe-4S dicluster domain-containing protein [Pseudomonadota bacterium]